MAGFILDFTFICFAFETKAIYNFMHSNIIIVYTDGNLKVT